MKRKSFECLKSTRNYKKVMFGTSDVWMTSNLSQQTSLSYCRLSDFKPLSILCIGHYGILGSSLPSAKWNRRSYGIPYIFMFI